jgi:hypothetical protein
MFTLMQCLHCNTVTLRHCDFATAVFQTLSVTLCLLRCLLRGACCAAGHFAILSLCALSLCALSLCALSLCALSLCALSPCHLPTLPLPLHCHCHPATLPSPCTTLPPCHFAILSSPCTTLPLCDTAIALHHPCHIAIMSPPLPPPPLPPCHSAIPLPLPLHCHCHPATLRSCRRHCPAAPGTPAPAPATRTPRGRARCRRRTRAGGRRRSGRSGQCRRLGFFVFFCCWGRLLIGDTGSAFGFGGGTLVVCWGDGTMSTVMA